MQTVFVAICVALWFILSNASIFAERFYLFQNSCYLCMFHIISKEIYGDNVSLTNITF